MLGNLKIMRLKELESYFIIQGDWLMKVIFSKIVFIILVKSIMKSQSIDNLWTIKFSPKME